MSDIDERTAQNLTVDERLKRGINRKGEPRITTQLSGERKHDKGRRQADAAVRAEESTIRSCGHPHTDNGVAFLEDVPFGSHLHHGVRHHDWPAGLAATPVEFDQYTCPSQ